MGKGNDSRHQRRKQAPISAHPAFATLVSLWFAALFGLGSLIPAIHPLASMIGLQAASSTILLALRIALAVFAALAGFALGRVVARTVARRQARSAGAENAARMPTMQDIEAEAARRPIFAHEELGSEGFGPVPPEDGHEAAPDPTPPQDRSAPQRIDSPWLADEDGHIWSEELADAPLALSTHDIIPEATTPVVPERPPLAELGMVELIERLALAIQTRNGLARGLPENAAEMVRRLDAEVQAHDASQASFKEIEASASMPIAAARSAPADAAVVFPDAGAQRTHAPERGEIPIAGGDRESDALRSALETLRRMSGTA